MSELDRFKVPPQNTEAEMSALGAMLIDNEAIHRAIEVIRPDDFYRESHRSIYEAIITLYQRNEPADLVTVTNVLKEKSQLDVAGGASYIASLVDGVPTAANVVSYCRIIREKAIARRLIEGATEIVSEGYEQRGNIDEYLDRAEKIIFEVANRKARQGFVPVKEIVKDSFKAIEQLYEKRELITGVPTGFRELDRLTCGLQPSDLVIIAARPSMGKTAFALNLVEHASVDNHKVCAVFSLEMAKEQLVQRMLCSRAEVDASKLRGGFLAESDWPRLTRAAGLLSEAPIFIDDSPALTALEIRAKIRRLEREHGIHMVVVDYLQLLRSHGKMESREREISEISRSLKALAKEINVPVIALSQLNRGVESRQDKRPQLSDLRESGCLTGDTKIMRADTGELVELKQLYQSGAKQIPVLSMGPHMKLRISSMSHVFSTGVKRVYELKMTSGRKIRATENHRFYTIEGWKRLDALQVGDHLAVPRTMEMITIHNDLSDERTLLLGHLIGDGCYVKRQPLHYTNNDLECLRAVADAAEEEFDITAKHLAHSDILWDKVQSIEYIKDEEVFDATVPGDHNFIANNIIVHNSIEQDADIVMFIYRDEMYNRDSPDAGKAEIIIGKQRNGPTGHTTLAFRSSLTRFDNLEHGTDARTAPAAKIIPSSALEEDAPF